MSRSGNWLRPDLRRAIHLRDGEACVYCGSGDRLTVDHLTPTARGGDNRLTNLVTACHACNSRKRDQTLAEFLAHDRDRYDEVRRRAKRRLTKIRAQLRFEEAVEAEVRRRLAALGYYDDDGEVPF